MNGWLVVGVWGSHHWLLRGEQVDPEPHKGPLLAAQSHLFHSPCPHPTPVCSEAGVGVPPPCLYPGPSVHLPPGLEAGTHMEETAVWPGSGDLLELGKGQCLLIPTEPLYMWLSGPQRTKRRPRRGRADWAQRGSRQDGPVWPPGKWLGGPMPSPYVSVGSQDECEPASSWDPAVSAQPRALGPLKGSSGSTLTAWTL